MNSNIPAAAVEAARAIEIQHHGEKWCIVDTSTAEQEVNWPGDLIGEYDAEWQAQRAYPDAVLAAALPLIPIAGGEPPCRECGGTGQVVEISGPMSYRSTCSNCNGDGVEPECERPAAPAVGQEPVAIKPLNWLVPGALVHVVGDKDGAPQKVTIVEAERVYVATGKGMAYWYPLASIEMWGDYRDALGRAVRLAWVNWAGQQPNPKPSWLVPYDDLSETDKEADRQIGEALSGSALYTHPAPDHRVDAVVKRWCEARRAFIALPAGHPDAAAKLNALSEAEDALAALHPAKEG